MRLRDIILTAGLGLATVTGCAYHRYDQAHLDIAIRRENVLTKDLSDKLYKVLEYNRTGDFNSAGMEACATGLEILETFGLAEEGLSKSQFWFFECAEASYNLADQSLKTRMGDSTCRKLSVDEYFNFKKAKDLFEITFELTNNEEVKAYQSKTLDKKLKTLGFDSETLKDHYSKTLDKLNALGLDKLGSRNRCY